MDKSHVVDRSGINGNCMSEFDSLENRVVLFHSFFSSCCLLLRPSLQSAGEAESEAFTFDKPELVMKM